MNTSTPADESAHQDRVVLDRLTLKPVWGYGGLRPYLHAVWGRRSFIWQYAWARSFRDARGTTLGYAWLLLGPFINALVLYALFGLMLRTGRGIPNFLGYVVVGANFFTILRQPLIAAGNILGRSRRLLAAFSFPAVSVILSWSVRLFLDFIPVLLATLLFVWVFPQHARPSLLWLLLIPLLAIAFVFSLGLALLTSALTFVLPDLRMLWPAAGRIWFYGSGVFYSANQFADMPILIKLMEANPGYLYLTMARDVVLYGTPPPASAWFYLLAFAAGVFLLGWSCFWLGVERLGIR